MCGPFNESLWPFAHEHANAQATGGQSWVFWSVGEKIHGILADAGVPADVHFPAPAGLNAVNEQIQAVIGKIEQWRSTKKLEQFGICHHVLGEHGGYAPVFQRVLPLDASWADERRSTPWPNRCLPMLGASRETVFTHLFRQYLFISFYRAFAQSLAAENAARLMAMQAAEKNIMDLLDDLQARFREQRQAGITNELLDIISGFEALSDRP
jgi:F-type H+-transporting ATPase subunit gamma